MPDTNIPDFTDGWTVNTLRQMILAANVSMERYLDAKFDDNEKLLNERYATQTKAVEAAFSAQQLAMATALTAAKQAVDTALASAKEATTKSEENAASRFELFRSESGAQITAVSEKLEEEKSRTELRIGDLTKRLDLNQGQGVGSDKQRTALLAVGGFVVAATALVTHLLFP